MDILQQCQKWHENDEYQKIIDALEAIPTGERTPEEDSELARAYNNLADPYEPGGKDMLKKAIALLKPHEEYFAGDHFWNFRMGYSYFYLDQEGRALGYFEKALEARPEDEDTKEMISWCKKSISLPPFSECFRERTENWWETFAEQEAELRRMMDEDKDHTRGAEIAAQMEEVLNLVFDEISFEMGFNGEKYELILTPEGDKVKLFELVYFRKHAPEKVLEHWNILVGRKPIGNIGLRTDDGWEISGEDVQIWLEARGEKSFVISAYCEKLLPMLREEEGRAWWMLTTLTDQVLGEIPHMRYIDGFDVLEEPRAEQPILLSGLPHKLEEKGLDLSTDPEAYLDTYTGYQMKPDEDPDADWRQDVIVGSTCCIPLVNGYLNADNGSMDNLHADGAAAGFFCYPLDTLREEEGSQKIFDFRDRLEEMLTSGDGPEMAALIGGATGLYSGYVDFIAWDIRGLLGKAKEFFEDSDLPWACFHTFRREAGSVYLKSPEEDTEADTGEQEDGLEETLIGVDYIPYTEQDAEAFFRQLEQWTDEDEYTRCIQALNAIPEELRNYRTAYALARALENYAIIGDHDEGTPSYKGDKALLRAIQVLEAVREEGQDRAEWNMRMAYGYQYLYGQEEKAIPYARRWAELDPEDENAPMVIRECQEEIRKRRPDDAAADDEDEADDDEADDEDDLGGEDDLNGMEDPDDEDIHEAGDAGEEGTGYTPKGAFCGFVLLSKGKWDKAQFIRDMKEKWDITVEEDESEDKSDDTAVFDVGDMIAAVSLMDYPIPNGEAELNAENNYMWTGAVKAAREHCAHIMVAVMGQEEDVLEKGRLYTKLAAACCRQKYAAGVYTSGVVFEPRFYEGFADMMQEDELPIFNWIWFGLYRSEGGMNAYTYGMDVFGKDEIEVLDADAEPGDLRDFLAGIVSYVLENDVELQDGETIGFSAEDKHAITRSPGVSLPEEQMTLKISYASGQEDPAQAYDEATLEPSELARAMMKYLDCECTYFPSMKDDDPIMSAYRSARRLGEREGFLPVLVKPDETLWECLVMNSDPDSDGAEDYAFDPEKVAEYRKKMLAAPVKDGKAVLEELTGQRREEAEDDDMDWEEDILGEMEGGYENCRFSGYWDSDTDMTCPLILARIPVKNPWEIFAYLPFGNWNECPDTPELMAAAKYWFQRHGAVPAAMTHDELEFDLPAPVPEEKAMEVTVQQYGFCPDMDQNFEDLGALADTLRQSDVWYFWWD